MTEKQMMFNDLLLAMGEGDCLTIAMVARKCGVHRETAHRWLANACQSGILVAVEIDYRKHIKQTLYYWVV